MPYNESGDQEPGGPQRQDPSQGNRGPSPLDAAVKQIQDAFFKHTGRKIGRAEVLRVHLSGGRHYAPVNVNSAIASIRSSPEAAAWEERSNCVAGGGTWDEATGSCTEKPSTDGQKECEAKGGTWDAVTSTCTPETPTPPPPVVTPQPHGGGANQPTHPGTYSYEPFTTSLPDIQPFSGPSVRPLEYESFVDPGVRPLEYESFVDPGVRPFEYEPFDGPSVRPFEYESFAGYEPFVAPTPESLLDDPGYQFRRSEGLRSVLHSAASRGLSRGGSALKALDRYGQGHASDEYDRVFGRSVTTHGLGRQTALDEYGAGRQEALDQYTSDVGAHGRAVTTHGLGRQSALDQYTSDVGAHGRAVTTHGLGRQSALDQYTSDVNAYNQSVTTHGLGRQQAVDQHTSDTSAHGRQLNEYLVNTGNQADQWNRSLAGWSVNNRAGLAGYQANTGAFDQYWARLLQQYGIDKSTVPPPYVPPPPPAPIFY